MYVHVYVYMNASMCRWETVLLDMCLWWDSARWRTTSQLLWLPRSSQKGHLTCPLNENNFSIKWCIYSFRYCFLLPEEADLLVVYWVYSLSMCFGKVCTVPLINRLQVTIISRITSGPLMHHTIIFKKSL